MTLAVWWLVHMVAVFERIAREPWTLVYSQRLRFGWDQSGDFE